MNKNLDWLAELPPGWAGIYSTLIAELEELRSDVKVEQAKEKFGELRVYIDKGSEEIYRLIDKATKQSRSACEICGAPAALRDLDGHFSTRCDEHAEGHAVSTAKPIAASFRIVGGKIYFVDR